MWMNRGSSKNVSGLRDGSWAAAVEFQRNKTPQGLGLDSMRCGGGLVWHTVLSFCHDTKTARAKEASPSCSISVTSPLVIYIVASRKEPAVDANCKPS